MGIDISYLGGNIVIVLSDKDKLIEEDTGNLLVEHIYEALGDVDVVECNEINGNMHHGGLWVDGNRDVFFFTSGNISDLKENGRTFLQKEGNMAEWVNTCNQVHLDFLRWFYSVDEVDIDSAIFMMYNTCDWEQTDPSCHQYRKTVEEDKVYTFREHRVDGNDMHDADQEEREPKCFMVEETLDIEDYGWFEIVDACGSFGYDAKTVDKWITMGEEIPLILECIFELN
jgi:hypothetical protein